MNPKQFQERYKDLLDRFDKEVEEPVDKWRELKTRRFKEKYNLSDNQVKKLQESPPF